MFHLCVPDFDDDNDDDDDDEVKYGFKRFEKEDNVDDLFPEGLMKMLSEYKN